MSWVAAAVAGGAVLGAYSSNQASNKQQGSANQASQTQLGMFNQTQSNLAPWMGGGKVALNALNNGLGLPTQPQTDWQAYLRDNPDVAASPYYGSRPEEHYNQHGVNEGRTLTTVQNPGNIGFGSLTKPFSMDDFHASPAYNFNLEQGTQAIDKAAAARHNFYAPATLQQIAKYSQGLASNEFQNAYSNYNTNLKNVWDRLYALSGSGQNAAAQQGGFGTTVGGQVGENQIGAGNAAAAGQIGQANAISSGVGSYFNNQLLSQYLSNQQRSSVSPSMGSAGANDIPPWMNA